MSRRDEYPPIFMPGLLVAPVGGWLGLRLADMSDPWSFWGAFLATYAFTTILAMSAYSSKPLKSDGLGVEWYRTTLAALMGFLLVVLFMLWHDWAD